LRLTPTHASAEFGLAQALQRMGQSEAAREHLHRFQQLTQEKISTPISNTYGEQGRYAMTEDMPLTAAAVGPMIAVRFVPQSIALAANTPAARDGGGACILGIENPGHKDLVVLGSGKHAVHAFRNNAGGKFEELPEQQTGLAAQGQALGCAVGDYDNDGLPDLAVSFTDRVVLFHNLGKGRFADVTDAVGIRARNKPAGLTFVDFDHDGDLDLYVTGSANPGGGAVLWRNNGNSTFTEWTGPTGLAGRGASTVATLSDINNDRTVDLVVTAATGARVLFAHAREGPFHELALYSQTELPSTVGVVAFDYNKDGWMDVAVTHTSAPAVSLWRNIDGSHFEPVALPILGAQRGWGLATLDIDNDGWIDLAFLIETANGSALRVLRNRGPQGFEDVSKTLGIDRLSLHDAR
jgi:hypothetical protein